MVPGAPVPFTEVELRRLTDYLDTQLDEAMDEHIERVARLDEWQRAYDGDPKQRRKDFPWPGCANLEIPLIGIACDSIVARIVNTIFSVEPFWTGRPLRKEVDLVAKPVESYLDWSRKAEFNMYRSVRNWTIEVVKFGWSRLKLGWEVYNKREYTRDANGILVPKDTLVRRPVVYHVLNRDVVTQAGVEDEDQAEWVAQQIRLTDNQLRMRRYDGVYPDIDKVIKTKDDITDVHETLKSSRDQGQPREEKLNAFYEFQIAWPYGPDDYPYEMLITYHRPTRTVMRSIFNPYGMRLFRKAKFIEREGRLEGFGIAKRLWQLQAELSTIHNQQVDNATVANTRFFLGKRNVFRNGTQIWPGRLLTCNDPERDFKAIQTGDVYPSMRALEISALSYAERASGVSDYQLGRESTTAGSRATATGTLALIQEGNRRFDLNVRDLRDVLSEVGKDLLTLNQLFRPRGAAYFVQGSDGQFTEEVLNLPPEFTASQLAIELTASTATINKEMHKQGLIGLLGIANQYYDKLIQASMAMGNPQIPGEIKEIIVKSAQGAKYIMDQVVQEFEIKAIDTVVPGLVNESRSELSNATGMPTGAAPERAGGMAGVPQIPAEYAGNGANGIGDSGAGP